MQSGLNTGLTQVNELKEEIEHLKQELERQNKTVEDLRENEEKFSAAFRLNPNALVLSYRDDGQIIDVNDAFLKLFETTRENVIGNTSTSLGMFGDAGGREQLLAELRKEGRITNHEIRIRSISGKTLTGLVSSESLQIHNKHALLTTIQDITSRKGVEEALRKSEDKLRIEHNILEAVISNIGAGFVVADINGNILSLNEAAMKMHDFLSKDDNLSKLSQYMEHFGLEYPDGETVPVERWPLSLAMKGVYFSDYIVRLHRKKDNTYRDISYNTVPIFDNGKPSLVVITMTDFTEIAQRTKELEESQVRYASLFNNSTLGIAHCKIILDEKGEPFDYRILQVNNAYTKITGAKKETVEGRTAREIYPDLNTYPYDYIGNYGRIALEGGELNFENYLEPFKKWLSVYAYSPKKYEFTSIFTDITQRKLIEEEALSRATEIEAILSCIAEGVVVYDREGRIVRWNDAARNMLKFDENKKNMNLHERARHGYRTWTEEGKLLMPDETPAYRSTVNGETIVNELLLVRTPDEKMWLNISSSPLIVSGRHTGGVVSMADVTRRKQVEENLARERELFEGIFNNIPVMITIYDPQMKHFRFNREMKNILGWSEKDAADGKLLEKIYPDPGYRKEVAKYMQSLEPGWKELKATAKDGTEVISTWANMYLSSGLLLGIGIDIRKRKEAEEALRKNEQRLQGIFNDVAIGIIELDSDDRIITVNERFCKILGYEESDLIGKTILEITAPPDRKLTEKMNSRLHEGDLNIFDYEKRYLRKDGVQLWVHVTVSGVRNSEGVHINSIGTVEDISERREALEALKQSEEKFRSLFENITEGVALHEIVYEDGKPVNYRIIAVNPAYTTHTGINPEDAIGGLATDVYGTAEPPFLEDYAKVAVTGTPYRFETFWEPMNKHFVVSAISPRKDQFATVLEDITEQKRNENEIRQKNEELTRFIYTVSHDLKSPLVTIKSFTTYLSEDIESNDKAGQEKDLSYIKNAADKMGKLLDELLELSRIGRKESPKTLVSLKTIVKSAIDLVAGRLEEKRVNVTFSGPDVLLFGHTQRFIQLFQNLIDNAAKFMGNQPKPLIEIGSFIDKENNNEIVLFVRDNGSGIDPRYHHKIFGLFEKMDTSTEGTGIGLALVKRIIEVHGGTIWFSSEGAGKGTTFYFRMEGTRIDNLKNRRQ